MLEAGLELVGDLAAHPRREVVPVDEPADGRGIVDDQLAQRPGSALTTMSSRSATRRSQTASVRAVSPVPPAARRFKGTVETSAARRHQRSVGPVQPSTASSGIWSRCQAGPEM
ncbi:MAG TPA: hypothetical protein VFZ00_34740 [Solirubrobacter sp.]|nr:hypothetical protein [Solirubrobacter sp.]